MAEDVAVIDETTAAGWGRRFWRWGVLLILLDVLVGATIVGVQLRRWAWDYTQMARFRSDITRNYDFGREALKEGYLNVYENQVLTDPPEEKKINYPPLRLGAFTVWAKWNQWRFGDKADQWQESYEFTSILMYWNTVLEWLGAVGAFLLVRHWIWRTGPPLDPDGMTGLDRALHGKFRSTLAFLILWFNPAMIASAHGWPSTDMWVLPFFVWTVLLCSWEKWFLAGLLMGVGAMFKGQQFFVVAMFVLWPIFAGQLGRALRFVCGFGLAAAIVTAGWTLTVRVANEVTVTARYVDWPAVMWVAGVGVAVGLANLHRVFRQGWRWLGAPLAIVAAGMIMWPAVGHSANQVIILLGLAAVVVLWGLFGKGRVQKFVLAGSLAGALLLCMMFFHGSTAWWKLGYMYGTERHMYLVVGPGNNLCALLGERFGWYSPQQVAMTIPAGWLMGWPGQDRPVELRHLLFTIYLVLMVISCMAIARQWRKNDRRFLVAIVVPWLLLYAICAQMHERYLLYGSGVAAVVVGCSFGLEILNLFLIVLTALQTVNCMVLANQLQTNMNHPTLNAQLYQFCEQIRPDISWGVLAATGVFFFAAFAPSRWRRPRPVTIEEAARPVDDDFEKGFSGKD